MVNWVYMPVYTRFTFTSSSRYISHIKLYEYKYIYIMQMTIGEVGEYGARQVDIDVYNVILTISYNSLTDKTFHIYIITH